jgi:hypothetical protein
MAHRLFRYRSRCRPEPRQRPNFLKLAPLTVFPNFFYFLYRQKGIEKNLGTTWVPLLKPKGYPTFINVIKGLGKLGTTCTRKSASWSIPIELLFFFIFKVI